MLPENRTSSSNVTAWDLAALALRRNRVDLMSKFDQVSGPHSEAIARLQRDFIEGNLDPAETIALAKVCMGVIDAAARVKE